MTDQKSRSDVAILLSSLGKIFLFLCFIPGTITYWHLRHNIITTWDETIVVNVITASFSTIASGLYGRNVESVKSENEIIYYKLLKARGPSFGVYYTDVLDAADSAQRSIDKTYGESLSSNDYYPYLSISPFKDQNNSSNTEPCIYISQGNKFCGNDVIHITSNTTNNGNKAFHSTNEHWIQNVIFQVPATSIWIFVNCMLAFLYWNRRVSPESVAKIYNRMIPQSSSTSNTSTTEIWRVFSGSTAHFEVLHLGMNMLSLSALGKELEGRDMYSTMSFFMYNCSLIVLVSTIWLGLQRLLQKFRPDHFDPNGATLGYSGVLFAWMVVASLEQKSTCPIIFAPNVCFPTYEFFGPFKFSFSPLAQLIVMQVILPRVSLTGHLSGIIAGFCIHWGLVPIRYFQPALLIPVLYILYLRNIRGVFIMQMETLNRSQVANARIKSMLAYQLIAMVYSITVIGPFSATTLSFAVTVLSWYQLFLVADTSNDSNSNGAIWAKAYIVSAVLVVISDAMTIGGWAAFSSWKGMPIVVMLMRTVLLFYCITTAQGHICNKDNGIFEWTLNYTTLQPCREIKNASPLIAGSTSTQFVLPTTEQNNAFHGVGHRLGGNSSQKKNPWKDNQRLESRTVTN